MNTSSGFLLRSVLAAVLTLAQLALAAPPVREIPDALKPWETWATWNEPDRDSPTPYSESGKRLNFWPSRLSLQVEPDGGRFELQVMVYSEAWIPLPGGRDLWPLDVMVNGTQVAVVPRDNRPSVQLPPGNHRIEGNFRWKETPQRIVLPKEIGILSLTVEGAPVASPTWDAQGELWLKREGSPEETAKDFLAVKVYAAIDDGIPLWLHTEVELIVSGKSREEDIGNILPAGWKLSAVESPIPVIVDETGRMKAQVRAGRWTVRVDAFRLDDVKEFQFAAGAKPAVSEELVAFRADPSFRMVDIAGATAIDVSQTTFPEQWRDLPVYRWDPTTPFRIEERMRGMGVQKPEGLKIARELWLDENGKSFTFRDRIRGNNQQIWRLDAAAGQDLGSVRSDGQGQLITRNAADGAPGVEIRTRKIDLEATGRLDRTRELPAVGWRSDADALRITLNIPPGWRLIALFGADWVTGDWLTAWTLLDIFLLLIFTLAVLRLWGPAPAVVAFLAFGLSFHEPGAPRYAWIALLIPLALQRVVPAGWPAKLVSIAKWTCIVILVLVLAPFAASQIQQALYPQLERVRPHDAPPPEIDPIPETGGQIQNDALIAAPAKIQQEGTQALVTKEYRVPPGFIPQPEMGKMSSWGASSSYASRSSAQGYLEAQGVAFPPGSSVRYNASSGKLIVRTTEANLDLIDTLTDASLAVGPGPNSNLLYDAKARIQTGPGVPNWIWQTAAFGWNGPVTAAQQVRPVLISTTTERLITTLRVALLLLLAGLLVKIRRPGLDRPSGSAAALLLAGIFSLAPATASAQIPNEAMLKQLRERLMEPSDAYPNAAAIPSVALSVQERKLSMEAEIHTAIRTAVPLPGQLPVWSPVAVTVNGKPEAALRRGNGYLWIVLPAGVHRVRVEGLLADTAEWEWTFQLKPHRVTVDAPGWTVSGVRPDGVPEQQVFFVRQEKSEPGAAGYDRQDTQPVVRIDRRIELGLVWQVQTTVRRLSPEGKAVSLRVPLLPGENVLSSNISVRDGAVDLRLGAQQAEFSWSSELPIAKNLELATRKSDTWVESWSLIVSPVWNVAFSGLPPIFEDSSTDLVPVWNPWPGESVGLTISRPTAVAGATITVNTAGLETTIGSRQRTSRLELSLRCSLGEDFTIGLPPGAEVTALNLAGQSIPVRKDGGRLIVPLRPGDQTLTVDWKTDALLSPAVTADAVQLPVESANISTVLRVPDNRWILWTHGPIRGPAVRFWIILATALVAACILGRLPHSPLRTPEWVLLGLGLTQMPLPAALAVIGWFFLLSWRGRESFIRLPSMAFNLLQLVVLALTAIALSIFIAIVAEGLLGQPEMFILGNGSTRTFLRWYQDRCGESLPRPGFLSVSIWWYRFLMLAWALWLAASLLRWLRWGWRQFSAAGYFRTKPKTAAAPPPLK